MGAYDFSLSNPDVDTISPVDRNIQMLEACKGFKFELTYDCHSIIKFTGRQGSI